MKVFAAIFSMLVLGICTGCTPNIYIPSENNIPLPGNKNELKLKGGLINSSYFLESSYAITNHIVVLADFMKNSEIDSNTFSNNWIGEIGGGYYSRFGQYGRFEILGGAGMGDKNTNEYHHLSLLFGPHDDVDRYLINCNFNHYFMQGDVAFSHKNAEFGLSAKFDMVSFTKMKYEMQRIDGYSRAVTSDSNLMINEPEVFFEPSFFLNIGLKNVKLCFNFGLPMPIGPDPNFWNNRQLYESLVYTFGLSVDLFRKD